MARTSAGARRSSHNSHNQPPAPAQSHQPQPQQQQQQHTLVLTQTTTQPSSRHYSDHPSLDTALDHIVAQFEHHLTAAQQQSQQQQHLQYDITQLFGYVDRLTDLAVLVFSPQLRAYEPHDKQWIKSAIYEHLKRQAAGQ